MNVAMDEDRKWWVLAAVQDGWLSNHGCPTTLADSCEKMEPKLADLALRLSGVPRA